MLPALFLALMLAQPNADVPPIVPWPSKFEGIGGESSLDHNSRIVADRRSLLPLARVLADEVRRAYHRNIPAMVAKGGRHDLVLSLDGSLKGERFKVDTTDGWRVEGGNYAAVAMGTSALLQSMALKGDRLTVGRFRIDDSPLFGYRGLMIDVARKPHSLESLRQYVEFCRLYRVRYLHLHLTDDQGWTFPSKAFPALGTRNEPYEGEPASPLYRLEELSELVRYADERGVTLVPEIDTPGHTGAMRRALGPPFDDPAMVGADGLSVLNIFDPAVGKAVDTILGEVAAVFRSSPYIHLGGDEAEIENWKRSLAYPAGARPWDLYLRYMNDRVGTVRKLGKTAIVWTFYRQHLGDGVALSKDVPIMAWEHDPIGATTMVANGYSVIHNPWHLNYRVDARTQYGADPYDVNGARLDPSAPLLGLQMNVWESTPDREMPHLRQSLPARMETVWHWPLERSYEDFRERWERSDTLLSKVLGIESDG